MLFRVGAEKMAIGLLGTCEAGSGVRVNAVSGLRQVSRVRFRGLTLHVP